MFSIALVHHPVRNRDGLEVGTAVTNLDLHDISRTARTYGANAFYVVTPFPAQHELVKKITSYWDRDKVQAYHPDRAEAFSLIRLKNSVEEAIADTQAQAGGAKPYVIVTSAKPNPGALSGPEIRKIIESKDFSRPILVLFGTGWGLADSLMSMADCAMSPILGASGDRSYNHLSVRAACAVILDRLFALTEEAT